MSQAFSLLLVLTTSKPQSTETKSNIVASKNQECHKLSVKFAEAGSLPLMALVSFPRSGNTWIRSLIEMATGIFTGSEYNTVTLLDSFPGESVWSDGTTIVQKTHHRCVMIKESIGWMEMGMEWRLDIIKTFNKSGILLIRDPYKAIESYWHLVKTDSFTKSAEVDDFASEEFTTFVNVAIVRWFEIIDDWLTYAEQLHVTFYEDWLYNSRKEMERVLEFLNIDPYESRLHCLQSDFGQFKRKKGSNLQSPYSVAQLHLFDEIIDKASEKMKLRIGKPLPLHLYEFYGSISRNGDKVFLRGSEVFWLGKV